VAEIDRRQACRIAAGDGPVGTVLTYPDGWVIWPPNDGDRPGDGATIVDRHGRASTVLSFGLADLAAAVARHHGITRDEVQCLYPQVCGPKPEADGELPDWAADDAEVSPFSPNPDAAPDSAPFDLLEKLPSATVWDGVDSDGNPYITNDHPRIPPGPDRDRLLAYLHAGQVVAASGRVRDVLDPDSSAWAVPIVLYTDGTWVWDHSCIYYLERYGLAPTAAFIDHTLGTPDPTR